MPEAEKYGNKKLSEGDAALIQNRLEKLIAEKAVYKNPDLKLSDVAREIITPPHQLSQLLNDNLGKSFTWYINEHRIDEACKILMTHNNLTIEAIGFEVGFNSRSTFFSAFKKIKGTTPALFQQQQAANSVTQ